MPDCPATEVAQCTYVDRNGVHCATFWCTEHSVVIGGSVLCRRHANTILALGIEGSITNETNLPDVFNRIPSLISWLRNDLDPPLQSMIGQHRSPTDLTSHPPAYAVTDDRGTTVWQSTWEFHDTHGTPIIIELAIRENAATSVAVLINGDERFRGTPPWILHRERNDPADPALDRYERDVFYQAILDAIRRGVMDTYRFPPQKG